jgi:hypothetical protein
VLVLTFLGARAAQESPTADQPIRSPVPQVEDVWPCQTVFPPIGEPTIPDSRPLVFDFVDLHLSDPELDDTRDLPGGRETHVAVVSVAIEVVQQHPACKGHDVLQGRSAEEPSA